MKKLIVIMALLGMVACGSEGRPIGSSAGTSAVSEAPGVNDFIGNAQEIQLGSDTRGRVGPNDLYDYYKFAVQQGDVIMVKLVGNASDDIDLFLYRQGQRLDSSESNGGVETITHTVLFTGTLQVGVKYYLGNASDYTLTVTTE
jgi:hypothetical protein